MLKGEERRLFAQILEKQALDDNGKWFIDEDGPIFDMELIIDALEKGLIVSLRMD
tara:strand:- start:6000 stop:6164 length:165 start_codon:yes stop_codon:yes gene_type:complete